MLSYEKIQELRAISIDTDDLARRVERECVKRWQARETSLNADINNLTAMLNKARRDEQAAHESDVDLAKACERCRVLTCIRICLKERCLYLDPEPLIEDVLWLLEHPEETIKGA